MAEKNGNAGPPTSNDGDGGGSQQHDANELSLEQALLAPLNSILKAQLHSARSFLNLLLQLGYPHTDDKLDGHREGEPFHMEFKHYGDDGSEQTLRVPALSLVPIAPLAVDSANFELEMAVKKVSSMQQMQKVRQEQEEESGEAEKGKADVRPWFLVDKPVSIEGAIAPPSTVGGEARNESQSSIKIKINVKSIPMPSGLDKLLTTLTNMGEVKDTSGGPKAEPEEGSTHELPTESNPDDPGTD